MKPATIEFDFRPVVIIGAARSGTNMLRDALARFDGVTTWPCDEINAIWRYGNAAFSSDELPIDAARPKVRRYVRAAFHRLAARTGARHVVEKTCANSLRVDFVHAIVPEAKFIFLVRGGRDVVASAMKRWRAALDLMYTFRKARFVPLADVPLYALRFARARLGAWRAPDRRLPSWGPRFRGIDECVATRPLAQVCARQWSECVLHAARAFARIHTSRYVIVRYESLVASPQEELARIAAVCDVPTSTSQLERIAKNITGGNVNSWLNDENADAVAEVEPMIDWTVDRLNDTLPQWADNLCAAA